MSNDRSNRLEAAQSGQVVKLTRANTHLKIAPEKTMIKLKSQPHLLKEKLQTVVPKGANGFWKKTFYSKNNQLSVQKTKQEKDKEIDRRSCSFSSLNSMNSTQEDACDNNKALEQTIYLASTMPTIRKHEQQTGEVV